MTISLKWARKGINYNLAAIPYDFLAFTSSRTTTQLHFSLKNKCAYATEPTDLQHTLHCCLKGNQHSETALILSEITANISRGK